MELSAGKKIETESFRIIRSEMKPNAFSEAENAVVVRVIHATGDFEYAENLRFSANAIADGRKALRSGCPIITDVAMVKSGISRVYPGDVVCWMHAEDTIAFAAKNKITRATAAFLLHQTQLQGAIVAVGNAPTALLECIRLAAEEGIRPALVVGVPVGFVNATESKDLLYESDLSYITALGRKGGSPVAAAIVNALIGLN